MSSSSAQKLNYIARLVKNCRQCSLCQTATHPVAGSGNPEAQIVFIGEAPGFHEDQQGLPFVGPSGKLLDKLLGSINLSRQAVFITNTVKHRPPANRDPQPLEIKTCLPFLKAQLKVIQPKIIITLGRFAMNLFLPQAYISAVHGQIKKISWQGLSLTLIPLYHPSAGLRNGAMLRALKKDFIKIKQFLDTIN